MKRISKKKRRTCRRRALRRALRLGRASQAAAEMATLPYVTVDAFTTVKFRGNPAAVVVFPKENTADALD